MATRIESFARVVRAHWNRAAKWPSWVHGVVLGTGSFVIVGAICLAGLKSTPTGAASVQVGQHDSVQVAVKVEAQQASIPAASEQQEVTVRAASNAAQMQTQPVTSNAIPPAVDFAQPVIPTEPIVIESDVVQDDAEVTIPEGASDAVVSADPSERPPTKTVESKSIAAKPMSPNLDLRWVAMKDQLMEERLRAHLVVQSRELDLDNIPKTSQSIWNAVKTQTQRRKGASRASAKRSPSRHAEFHPLRDELVLRTDFGGVPFQMGEECHTGASVVQKTQAISAQVRSLSTKVKASRNRKGKPITDDLTTDYVFSGELAKAAQIHDWYGEESIPALVQMLQVEGEEVRLMLISILSSIKSDEADVALAKRALYDLSPTVRQAAIDELTQREYGNFRNELLTGFRYPWAPVAQHAAEALVQLDDRGALDGLVDLLDDPNPAGPHVNDQGQVVQRELTRVNHMRNCLMCHAPSLADTDPLRGLAPTPGQPMPVGYYQSRRGNFVRADITYLRQDFSVMHHVDKSGPWPAMQRYDYFVREQPLSRTALKELAVLLLETSNQDATLQSLNKRKSRESHASLNNLVAVLLRTNSDQSYPQRDAALYALRKIADVKLSDSSREWRKYLDSLPSLSF